MPKITHQRIHRLHISLFDQQYEKLRQLAARTNTSISYLLRRQIYELIKNEDELNQRLQQSELEFMNELNEDETKSPYHKPTVKDALDFYGFHT